MSSSPRVEVALVVIDLRPDFMPGGPLACHDGDAIVAGIDQLLRQRRYRDVVATQDWHPRGHVSFASSHPGCQRFDQISLHEHTQTLWPDHCVPGTPGAELHPAAHWSVRDTVIGQGSNPRVDSYSGFRENHGPMAAGQVPGWRRGCAVAGLGKCICAGLRATFACGGRPKTR